MIAWILDRAKERSTWMGLFSLAGAVGWAVRSAVSRADANITCKAIPQEAAADL